MALIKRPSAREASKSKINNPWNGVKRRRLLRFLALDSLEGVFNAFLMEFSESVGFCPCRALNA